MDKSDLVNEENADSARYSPEDKGDTSNEDSIQIGIKIAASEENSEISADIVKGDESERTMKAQDNHIDSNNENMNAFSEKQNGDTSVTTKAQPEEVVANNVAKDKIDKTISSEFIPDLNIDDTGIDNSGTNDTRDTTMGPNGVEGSPDSNKVLWTLNGSDLDNHKDEVNDTVMDKLLLPSNDAPRRVSFGDENISIKEYDMLADRRKSEGMGYDMRNRHSYRGERAYIINSKSSR